MLPPPQAPAPTPPSPAPHCGRISYCLLRDACPSPRWALHKCAATATPALRHHKTNTALSICISQLLNFSTMGKFEGKDVSQSNIDIFTAPSGWVREERWQKGGMPGWQAGWLAFGERNRQPQPHLFETFCDKNIVLGKLFKSSPKAFWKLS